MARSAARRRSRAAARDARVMADGALVEDADTASPSPDAPPRSPLFRLPNVREDARQLPDMFRTKRLLWLPFVLLIASFAVALGMPYTALDAGIAQFLIIFVQMAFLPQGLIVFLIGGFLAPRAAYMVGLLLGVLNAALLIAFAGIRSEDLLAGTDPSQAQVGLALLIGYALVVGPLAAAFAAWYRSFLNRMNGQGRERRLAREQEQARKRKEEARAARRPQRSKSTP